MVGVITSDYLELYRKAHEFANFAGYTLIVTPSGYFDFYNCPVFKSFNFEVDPYGYEDSAPEDKIIREFNKR